MLVTVCLFDVFSQANVCMFDVFSQANVCLCVLVTVCVCLVSSEDLKLGLTTETKAWRMHYGKLCNKKYSTEMEEIFNFIEDLQKRLSRPIKDLDDIRHAMASLKDIRENEIRIDMSIGPIEVWT